MELKPVTMDIKSLLATISEQRKNWTGYVPEEAQCQACLKLLGSHPWVQEQRRRTSVPLPRAILCRCQEERDRLEAQRRSMANLPGLEMTFGTFMVRPGTREALDAALYFSNSEGPPVLVMVGQVGSGRTHLLSAIGHECLNKGKRVRYEVAADLVDGLRSASFQEGREVYDHLINIYRTVPVLLLDDIGLERATDFAIECLYTVIDVRYRNGKRLAVVTNSSEFGEIAGRLGDRIASRLFDQRSGLVHRVVMTASDYRRKE